MKKYQWDPKKNEENVRKHKISFDYAHEVIAAELCRLRDMRCTTEERWILVGMLENRMMVLVFTPRQGGYRIISLRKANKREKRRFEAEG